MPSCVFRWCTNYESKVNKAQGISYHSFPADEVRYQEWISIVRAQRREYDWMPSKSSTICSDHFTTKDTYTSKKGRSFLKKDAIPITMICEIKNIKNSPSGFDNVSVSDMEEILESPTIAALKKRVCKLKNEKKQLRKRNKIVLQHNKRLKKRVAGLRLILKDLKNILKEQFSQLKLKTKVQD